MLETTCQQEKIAAYLNDSLSPEDEFALERHLNGCNACRDAISDAAGSGDDWVQITAALRPDLLDECDTTVRRQQQWPIALLGPSDDPRMLGRIGPFEVSGCVGVGGMGVVFKARDPALDRYVAVKVLSPQLAASETARIRFEREARAAAAVVHDNVIAVHQVSEYQGLPYLVMPYLPGPSLEERLRRHGPMAPVEALRVARQVAAGLQAAHAQGLIHRDIKPANILLSGDTERAIITDFGLARAVDDATLTRSGALAGTPQFMAPEQARGEATNERSDLFSLGALLFAMLTGRPPVPELTGAETVRRVGNQPPPKLDDVLEDVPRRILRVVESLHVFDPRGRMADAGTVERQLASLVSSAPSSPLRSLDSSRTRSSFSSVQRVGRWLKSRPRTAGVLVGLTLLVGSWILVGISRSPANTEGSRVVAETDRTALTVTNGPTPTEHEDSNRTQIDELAFESQVASETAQQQPTPDLHQADRSPPMEDLSGSELDELLMTIDQGLERLENR